MRSNFLTLSISLVTLLPAAVQAQTSPSPAPASQTPQTTQPQPAPPASETPDPLLAPLPLGPAPATTPVPQVPANSNQTPTIPGYGAAQKANPNDFPAVGNYTPQKSNTQQQSPISGQTTSGQQQNTPQEPIRTLSTPQQGPPVIVESDNAASKPSKTNPVPDFFALAAYNSLARGIHNRKQDHLSSAYIDVDSWVYPEVLRLYSMDFIDTAFLSMRPYTRRSLLHMLTESQPKIMASNNEEAKDILASLLTELEVEEVPDPSSRGLVYGSYSLYTRLMGVRGQTLRDSYHLGQTLANDYGRPYQSGFNNITGFSTLNEFGRFTLYLRGEYQFTPSAQGYSDALAANLLVYESTPYNPAVHYDILPNGFQKTTNRFDLQEAYLSFHLLGHEISGGKTDAWLGPGVGGATAWSNNAEDIYSFRINRVEPLTIPLLSRLLGPFRYDFMYGSLKGHTQPNVDYTDSIMVAFKPTKNVDIAFQRTIIFGGKGHEPVTLHNFLKGFFSINDTTSTEKYSRTDPGARFSDFSFSYRLPFVRKYATLYVDSEAHDDVSPISAPRRAAYRTGLFLSQLPGLPKLSFRVEGADFNPPVTVARNGQFEYLETIQLDGYTNKGFIFGDPIGREAIGGNAWLTYHLSGNEWVEVSYMNKKQKGNFVGGTTQNQFKIQAVKRLTPDIELNAWYQYEGWKAPIYKTGLQQDSVFAAQFTWYPKLHTSGSDVQPNGQRHATRF